MGIDFVWRHSDKVHIGVFNFHGVNSVFSITKLNNSVLAVSNRHIIFNLDVLHAFNQAALNISCLRRFDRGVNKTNTTAHGVKEHLRRRESGNKRVFNKSSRGRTVIVFGIMGQRSTVESVRHALTVNGLLTDQTNHLGNIHLAAL